MVAVCQKPLTERYWLTTPDSKFVSLRPDGDPQIHNPDDCANYCSNEGDDILRLHLLLYRSRHSIERRHQFSHFLPVVSVHVLGLKADKSSFERSDFGLSSGEVPKLKEAHRDLLN